MEARLSALFEERVGKVEREMRVESERMRVESERVRAEMNDKIDKQRVEIESLRSNMARVESDNTQLKIDNSQLKNGTQLKIDNARLTTDLSEVHNDLRILNPLPSALHKLAECIKVQEACNIALHDFFVRNSIASINSELSLSLRLQELDNDLEKARIARLAATHLCLPPPTLVNVLHIVAERGFTKEVKKCMNLNKAIRSCDKLLTVMREMKTGYGLSQLHYFASKGMKSSVNRMLSMKGIDVESRSNRGNTPLINASALGHKEIVEILLNHGAMTESKGYIDGTALYFACKNGHLPVVKLLISKGANLNAGRIDGWRTIHIDMESKDINGETPLILASSFGHVNIVEMLLNHGAKIEGKSNRNGTSLHFACHQGHLPVITLLISKGANLEAIDCDGRRPMQAAACCVVHLPVINLLISYGANFEASDFDGWRTLHSVARRGAIAVVKALIAKGADMNALTYDGQSALGIARRKNHLEVVAFLQSKGAIDDGRVDSNNGIVKWEQLLQELQQSELSLSQHRQPQQEAALKQQQQLHQQYLAILKLKPMTAYPFGYSPFGIVGSSVGIGASQLSQPPYHMATTPSNGVVGGLMSSPIPQQASLSQQASPMTQQQQLDLQQALQQVALQNNYSYLQTQIGGNPFAYTGPYLLPATGVSGSLHPPAASGLLGSSTLHGQSRSDIPPSVGMAASMSQSSSPLNFTLPPFPPPTRQQQPQQKKK